jgi:drug/metabolite transporter (DMT)-like permease
MLKACTPVAVLLFSFVAGIETPNYLEVYIVVIICIGVAMTSVGEMYFSMIGFTFQSLGILAESARLVMVNALMKDLKLDPLSSLYYIAPLCFAFIAPACLYFEGADIPVSRILSAEFGGYLLLNGLVAFLLNVAVVLLIHNKSALILTLAGILKDLLLVGLSMIIFGSPVTSLQYVGYAIALIGLNMHKEYKKNPEKMSAYLTSLATCDKSTASGKGEEDA